jgi:hypothetical protein
VVSGQKVSVSVPVSVVNLDIEGDSENMKIGAEMGEVRLGAIHSGS